MKILYDLHCHSYWSDGDYALDVVVGLAKKQGLNGIVLADHDTILGWPEFQKAVKQVGFEFIQGVEISALIYDMHTHILGYSRHFDTKILKPLLEQARFANLRRVQATVKKLKENDIADVDVKKLQNKKGKGAVLSKYDIQKELAEKYGLDLAESGAMMHERNGLVFVPYDKKNVPEPQKVIKAIHKANGLAILAHPGEMIKRIDSKQSLREAEMILQKAIIKLIACGIDGIEVYSPRNTKEQEQEFLQVCCKKNLIITGGSDFHGFIHAPQRPLGLRGLDKKLWQEFLAKLP